MSDAPSNRSMAELEGDPAANWPAPHSLCNQCRHFICKHPGYPGRVQSGDTCAVMEMHPVTTGRNEIVRCNCTRRAVPRG